MVSFYASVWLHAVRAFLRPSGVSGQYGPRSGPGAVPRPLRFSCLLTQTTETEANNEDYQFAGFLPFLYTRLFY